MNDEQKRQSHSVVKCQNIGDAKMSLKASKKEKKKVTYKDKNQMPSSSKFWLVRIFKIEFYIYQNISQAWGEY